MLVVNFNGARFASGCLDSLKAQTVSASEIILVDNASTDESLQIIEERHADVTLVKSQINLGLGGGLNRGLRTVVDRFEFVGILNSDTKADSTWLACSLETLRSDDTLAACASLCLGSNGVTVDSAGGSAINLLMGIWGGCSSVAMDGAHVAASYGHRPFPVFYPVATAFVARSSAFARVGLFDDAFGHYFVDVDWGWRCRLAGLTVVCDPRAVVHHHGYGSDKSRSMKLEIARRAETNLLVTYHKNLSTSSQAMLLPILFVSRIVISLSYFPISPHLTMAKLLGLAAYMGYIFTDRSRQVRLCSQSNRQCSDFSLYAADPRNGISIGSVLNLLPAWMRVMRSIFGR